MIYQLAESNNWFNMILIHNIFLTTQNQPEKLSKVEIYPAELDKYLKAQK
jgi:hypothetical protein